MARCGFVDLDLETVPHALLNSCCCEESLPQVIYTVGCAHDLGQAPPCARGALFEPDHQAAAVDVAVMRTYAWHALAQTRLGMVRRNSILAQNCSEARSSV